MFSCEFFEMFKNTFFVEHFWWLLLRLLKEKDRFKVMKKDLNDSFYSDNFDQISAETVGW